MKKILLFLLVTSLSLLIFACNEKPNGEKPRERFSQFYQVGDEVSMDLNGDGVKEKIYYGLDDFKINNVSYKKVIQTDVYENTPQTEKYFIVDIDIEDEQREIGLMVNGPSDDLETFFFSYDGEELLQLGSVPCAFKDLEEGFNGKGSIIGTMRLEVLQTWWAPAEWILDSSNYIELSDQELFNPIQDWKVELKIPLPIYKNIGDSNSFTMLEPQEVTFPATDNREWCQVEGKDGVKGWFKIEGFYYLPDLGKDAIEVFDNLLMAD